MSSILRGIELHSKIHDYVDGFRDSGGWPDEADHAVDLISFIEAHLARAVPKTESERIAFFRFTFSLATQHFVSRFIEPENLERELRPDEGTQDERVILRALQIAIGLEPTQFPENAFKRQEA